MPRDELVEHARGLGVHEQRRAVLLHLLECPVEGTVIGLPPLGLVDHELLERGEAALHHPFDLVLMLVPARDADVERVVDERFALGLLHPVVGRVGERVAGVGDGEVDERGDTAACTGARAGPVVVRGDGAAERELEMDVHVEHAGDDVVVRGVDERRARSIERGA